MSPSPDRLPSDDAIQWMLSKLTDKQRAEFDSGLSKWVYRLEQDRSVEVADSLLEYVRSWLVSITLQFDDEWQTQMAQSADRFARGDVGEPADSAGLQELLGI